MKPMVEATKVSVGDAMIIKAPNDGPKYKFLLYGCLGVMLILLAVLVVFVVLTYQDTKATKDALAPLTYARNIGSLNVENRKLGDILGIHDREKRFLPCDEGCFPGECTGYCAGCC